MINLSIKRNPGDVLTERITERIDKALILEDALQPKREYLGGSIIGKECERLIQYMATNTAPDPGKGFSGRMLRIFDRGHWVEGYVIQRLKKAGYWIMDLDEYGKQIGFESHDGLFRGHRDGVFLSGPDCHAPYPRLFECKGLEQKYFLQIKTKGLEAYSPTYYGQCQIYMKKFNLTENPAFFAAVNMNRMELYFEPVEYNREYAARLEVKADRIIRACRMGELLPRMHDNPDFFKCKACSYRCKCHGVVSDVEC